jgi:hypothetical protein
MMKHSKSFVFALSIAVLGGVLPLSAHSWYPWDCCSGEDCKPTDSIERDEAGDYRVAVDRHVIIVPRSFPIRPSQDHRSHICYQTDQYLQVDIPRCFFLSVGS